jgi:hypothetical protein
MQERRQFLRLDAKVPVRYQVIPSTEARLMPAANLGGGGICIFMPEPVLVGKLIELELTLPDPVRTIKFNGQVVWCKQEESPQGKLSFKTGIEILFIDGQDHKALTQFCIKRAGSIPPEALDIP